MNIVNQACCEALESRRLLASVTLITHGFNSNVDGWVTSMADAFAWRQGLEVSQQPRYRLTATDPGHSGGAIQVAATQVGPPPGQWELADIVLLLDWSDVAGTLPFGGYNRPSGVVAQAVATKLMDPAFIPGLGGALAELPLHLVGHSRGGALVSALAETLSARGIWVDHVTTLDPHPVDGVNEPLGLPIDWGDGPVEAWQNVIFHDNYWRTDGPFSLDPTGQPVANAFDLQLSESVLATGGYSQQHSSVHLWYFGTADTRPGAHNGDHAVPANWYQGSMGPREEIGYYFARTVGGPRPLVGVSAAFGGQAGRVAVSAQGVQWPNVGLLSVAGPAGSPVAGAPMEIGYRHQDRDSGAEVTFYLDENDNPYDSSVLIPLGQVSISPGGSVGAATAVVSTQGVVPGDYYLLAKVSDGIRIRYDSVPIHLTAPLEVEAAAFAVNAVRQKVLLTFSKDIGQTAGTLPVTLQIQNLTTQQAVSQGHLAVAYNAATRTAEVTFPGYDRGILPNGNYRLHLPAGSVSGVDGTPLLAEVDFDFYFLQGDANRDRAVNLADLAILRANFGQNGRTFSQGDFNYDQVVNLQDLAILRSAFGMVLPPPAGGRTLFGEESQSGEDERDAFFA